jgi:hypothetical protein
MTRALTHSHSDDADAKRLEIAMSQLIQLLARQSAREISSGAQAQEDGSPDDVCSPQED